MPVFGVGPCHYRGTLPDSEGGAPGGRPGPAQCGAQQGPTSCGSVGGIRASNYNSISAEGAKKLAMYIETFAQSPK